MKATDPQSTPDRRSPGSAVLCSRAWEVTAAHLALSKRQLQIVRAVFDDATEYAISEGLSIAQSTVHTHIERIYKKLGVHDRTELVILVIDTFLHLTADPNSGLPPICGWYSAGDCPLDDDCGGD